MKTLVRSSSIDSPLEELARWQLRPATLGRLIPPWLGARVTRLPESIHDGAMLELRVRCGLARARRWATRMERVNPVSGFSEVLVEGPLSEWSLERRFREESPATSRLEEHVSFSHGIMGGRRLEERFLQVLNWRHRRTRQDLARQREVPMALGRMLLTGASGLVGKALCSFLEAGGHEVRRLVRREGDASRGEFHWDPVRGVIDVSAFEGVDSVVHLAGAGIADRRWTSARMELIRASRIDSTRLIAETIAGLSHAPSLVCASAAGFYGNRPDGTVDERDEAGSGFLAETCSAWEGAAQPAREAGSRVVHLRIGVVVAGAGGAVAKMRGPVLAGIAGPLGHGRQGMSWIALDDLLGVVLHASADDRYSGAINVVAPQRTDNRTFIRTLGKVLSRPTLAPMPAFVARMLFGRLAEEALLTGAFVQPRRLAELGFRFDFADLEEALRFELGRASRR